MKNTRTLLAAILFGSLPLISSAHAGKYTALPVPRNIRVASSAPRAALWKQLTPREKRLAFHLLEASRVGRAILFLQNHRHSLLIKAILERALAEHAADRTRRMLGNEAFAELIAYAAKFVDLAGPYESSNRKYLLTKLSPGQVARLIRLHNPAVSPQIRDEIVKLLTDPEFEVIQYPEESTGADLAIAGGNMYEHGLTGAEVQAAIQSGLKSNLNCRIVRDPKGGARCQVQALNNPNLDPVVDFSLTAVVTELVRAREFASTALQRKQIDYLIKFLREGNIEDFRQSNIAWVQDRTSSRVDFMMGYVEVYQDYQNQIGSWESYVQIIDPDTTRQSVALAKNAQAFEDAMPYGIFKKKFPENYSPPALMAYYFREVASFHSGGYNLPNFDDIRRDVGAKNVIRLSLPGEDSDPESAAITREWYAEFMPAAKLENTFAMRDKTWRTLVMLHEIIGHGSGTYDTAKYGATEDPISALGSLGSALEEQRADLTALVFANDPKLVASGVYKDQAEADRTRDAMYDYYLGDFLRRTAKARTFTESHQRGHWLYVSYLLKKGAAKFMAKDGSADWTPENYVLQVTDYDLFYRASVELLAELQRIKANRDEAALKQLFADYAPLEAIEAPWAQAAIVRGSKLRVSAGYVEQPWRVSKKGGFQTFGTSLTLEGIAPYWPKW